MELNQTPEYEIVDSEKTTDRDGYTYTGWSYTNDESRLAMHFSHKTEPMLLLVPKYFLPNLTGTAKNAGLKATISQLMERGTATRAHDMAKTLIYDTFCKLPKNIVESDAAFVVKCKRALKLFVAELEADYAFDENTIETLRSTIKDSNKTEAVKNYEASLAKNFVGQKNIERDRI